MQQKLNEAYDFFDIKSEEKTNQKLVQFVDLIYKWNKVYNLTAHQTKEDIFYYHIIDSLSIVNFIKQGTLLDVGSGAGLPGIVIAILKPNVQVSVLDSVGKKCRFMQFCKTQLKIDNLTIINKRVEDLQGISFEQITTRAFATVEKTLSLTKHLLSENTTYWLMKGNNFAQEEIKISYKTHHISVPNVAENRYLLEINL
ncbi:rRNA small subunit 7-methylguanosine (m7G) methyltransferase GidB [hydrothermal vent metagenome]|uniref:rRNA small subunit 7-methylguanosine (M7G) methyltransferase GidB n=1 Tax=hydrothermal vent metagenome TaxID=652676 RepID=A0A1W1CW37_9ZZZZ